MKYECTHAREADGIPYIICDREPPPSAVDKQNLYHSLCPYQRFCGQKRCAVLLPEWAQCKKNAADKPQESVEKPVAVKAGGADTPAKKSAQKRRK